jgi:tetratricopeptide (TPR) repeat protein
VADFITDLYQIAAEELRSNPQKSTQQHAEKLKVTLKQNLELQAQRQSDPRSTQINSGDVTAFQTHVLEGIANIGLHLHGVDRATLLEIVQEVLRSFQPVGIAQNLPSNGTSTFVGRETDMAALHEQLQKSERVAIASIHGMGGIGKTELALQYALRHLAGKVYSGGVCWLRSREEVGTQIVSFARSQLSLEPPEDLEVLEQVKWCWRNWQAGETLVVFDDVQEYTDVESFLPPAGEHRFKVVMTTRLLKMAKSVQNFEIEVLDEASALNLLRAIVSDGRIDQNLETAKQLCEWLGYLPLGLELVGEYLENDADIELWSEDEDCLGLWQRLQKAKLEAIALKETYSGMTATDGVAAAFELSWKQLNEAEQRLAALLSLFALAEIPWVYIRDCLPSFSPEELEVLRNRKLLGLHLLQRTGKGMYQLHQLIREFFAAKRSRMAEDEAMKRSFCGVMVAIANQISQTVTLAVIEQVTPAIPHIKEAATTLAAWLTDEELIAPSNRIAQFYEGQLAFGEAEEWFLHGRGNATQRLGQDHSDVAIMLNNLAGLYLLQGRYEKAEPLLQQSLEIDRRCFEKDAPEIATSLNNLAELYSLQGRYVEAEPLYLQSLEIRQRQLEQDHPDVASSLNNLANLYRLQGRYIEAEPLYLQALEIWQQQLGQDHPHVASNLNNLAGLYELQGRYIEAEPLYLQALKIWQQQLGQDHPHVALSLNNLANLYRLQGRYVEAEPLYLQSLEICQRQLGQDHPYVASSLNNLAELYKLQGRYIEAETQYLQTLRIGRQTLGEDHPDVAIRLNNLAGLYATLERYAEAEPLCLQAIIISNQRLGESHPKTQNFIENFQKLLQYVIQSDRTAELSDHPMTRSLLQLLQNKES